MIVTEETAKTMACCGQTTFSTILLALTDKAVEECGRATNNGMPMCEGSVCMAWQWEKDETEKILCRKPLFDDWKDKFLERNPKEPPRPDDVPASYIWVVNTTYRGNRILCYWEEPEDEFVARRLGYCGLARRR